MKAFEFFAEVDAQRRVQIALPSTVMPGTVRVIILTQETDEDEAGVLWMQGVAREWADELADTRQDIYTLEDGEPVDAAR
jgi:hypothetical protein